MLRKNDSPDQQWISPANHYNYLIKKTGGSQPIGTNNLTTSINDGKSGTLAHKSHTSSTSIKPKHKKKGKKIRK